MSSYQTWLIFLNENEAQKLYFQFSQIKFSKINSVSKFVWNDYILWFIKQKMVTQNSHSRRKNNLGTYYKAEWHLARQSQISVHTQHPAGNVGNQNRFKKKSGSFDLCLNNTKSQPKTYNKGQAPNKPLSPHPPWEKTDETTTKKYYVLNMSCQTLTQPTPRGRGSWRCFQKLFETRAIFQFNQILLILLANPGSCLAWKACQMDSKPGDKIKQSAPCLPSLMMQWKFFGADKCVLLF